MIKRAALIALLLLLAAYVPALAQTGGGIIRGQVVNGTAGGAEVGGVTLTLKTYLSDVEQSAPIPVTAKTDENGNFEFSGLATDSTYSYEVTLNYQQADYTSERAQFLEGETEKSIELTVYDATASDENIKSHLAQVEAYFTEGQLMVIEYYVFVNEGDKTLVGSEEVVLADGTKAKETLRFSLPQDADKSTLNYPEWEGQALMPCCVSNTGEGFVDTMAFIPGNKVAYLMYIQDYTSPDYVFSTALDYPADLFYLWILGEGIQASSDQLALEDSGTDEQGIPYQVFSAQNVQPGTELAVTLSGLPKPGATSQSSQNTWKWVGLGLVIVLGLGFGVGYPLFRRRQPAAVKSSRALETRREELLQELATLDDDFDAGRIPEQEYRQQRARKKAQLVRLTNRVRGKD